MTEDTRTETEFDMHSPEYTRGGVEIEADLRARCPVSWSSRHGGFWAVASHDAVTAALRDRELCSSKKTFDEQGDAYGGLTIPPPPGERLVPDELDPPEWDGYRKLLNPPFAPPAIAALRPRIEAFTTEVINNVIEAGRADLVNDVTNPITALVTLDILGLPLADWRYYSEPLHRLSYDHFNPEVSAAIVHALERIGRIVAERRQHPGRGLIDDLLAAEIDGEPITDKVMVDIVWQLLLGGFETTGSLLANVFWYLDDHRDEHDSLVRDDAFLRTATEEFVRWVSPVVALARTGRQRMELEGQVVSPGERMWMMYRSANRDPKVFENPDEVELTRFPNRHIGFGTGIHRCLGSNLARAQFQIVLRQVLIRMPDYRIDRDAAHRLPNMAQVNGWIDMPARFTPGARKNSGLALDPDVLG